ncbi:WD repeat domain 19 [Strigomonas culicis]|nr:WD repeat domain 19 [Strigomonas culicis]|eukprot:EPY21242.1 WD repeat domain 19 [Strigomonas culicis]
MSLMEAKGTPQMSGIRMAVVNIGNGLELFDLRKKETFSAQFDPSLGSIATFKKASDTSFMIGFSSGTVGLAVLRNNELNLCNSVKASKAPVQVISFGEGSGLGAVATQEGIRMYNRMGDALSQIKENGIDLASSDTVVQLRWSPDGQTVVAARESGSILSFTLKTMSVNAVCGILLFYLISPLLVGVKNVREGKVLCTIPIDAQPEMMGAGMGMLAVVVNKSVYYYEYYIPNSMPQLSEPQGTDATPQETQSKLVRKVDYPAAIQDVKVSSCFAAVLFGGRVQLHSIREGGAASLSLPEGRNSGTVVAVGISEPLFMYVTNNEVCVITLQNLQTVAQSARPGIKRAFPNPMCTRVAYMDENNALYVFNPITDVASLAEGHVPDHKNVLWDQGDSTVFVTYDANEFVTFVCVPHSRLGSTCESILIRDTRNDNLTTPLGPELKPLCLLSGSVMCQSSTGSLQTVPLRSHTDITSRMPSSDAFYNNFSLNRLRWASQNISSLQEAEDLAIKALHMLDVELAIRVYRQLSQPSLVLFLEKIKHIHEKNLLVGHVSMIMGYYKDAQSYFLRSSRPICALEMRRDFMQWEPALTLAKDLAPDQIPVISKEYAQQLEYRGDYAKALDMYKNGKRSIPTGHAGTQLTAAVDEANQHNQLCLEGTGRCSIRIGNVKEGVSIAMQSESKEFAAECAKLCEDASKFEEAAQLYEKAGDIEKAATLFIEKSHNLKAAGRLLPQIESRNIIGKYAQAKENEGAFAEALEAYTQAEDWDNVVRLKVDKLNDLHGAYVIVRKTRSANAASLVSKTCKKKGEFSTAVEFLVLAKSTQEAFELAKQHNCVFNYESALLAQTALKDGVAPLAQQPDYLAIAQYYEGLNKAGQAGLYYHISGDFPMALKKYLEAGEPEDIEKAVEVVGLARNDALTNKLIDYLMGETDGEPKDPSYIFKLYMALGSYEKAAKTSVIIASKEQELGNYKSAHKTLVESCKILREKNLRVPNDLKRTMMILHSYIIVKDTLKVMKDEMTACRMLLRVAHNIQRFPKHVSTILTTTVLQCLKSHFKKSAFEFACVLIQNEKYRTELSEKNRKKIEGVVRRRGKDEMVDPVETLSPCPICDAPVAETELDCGACKNTLPFCIVTGKHVLKSDFTLTPCCSFPAIYSQLCLRLREVSTCPMCDASMDINKVLKIDGDEIKNLL